MTDERKALAGVKVERALDDALDELIWWLESRAIETLRIAKALDGRGDARERTAITIAPYLSRAQIDLNLAESLRRVKEVYR